MHTFKDKLKKLKSRGLLRKIRDRASSQGREIVMGGMRLINFSSNDYLGLSNRPEIMNAVTRAVQEYGTGSGASRLLSGGTDLHRKLEEVIAEMKETEASILFNSGYAANTGVLPAISETGTTIFSDELNHASLIDGCRLSRATVYRYRHKDIDHLSRLISIDGTKQKLIVTDSIFSMDGDVAPLPDLAAVAEDNGAILYIDDAHGTGVLGGGRGALHHFGLLEKVESAKIIQMGTLSKAVGSIGAFIAADRQTVEWIINSARSLIFSTALPSHIIAASIEAIRLMQDDGSLVERLWRNRGKIVEGLNGSGIDTGMSESPIIPIVMEDNDSVLKASAFLMERGIYIPPVRRPAVKRPRLRLTVSATHTSEDIEKLIKILREAKRCGLLS